MTEYLSELETWGVRHAVVTGRQTATAWGGLPNEDVAAIVADHPGRFIGYAGIDGSDPKAAVAETERAVGELGLRGISVDPGFSSPPMYPDDEKLHPLYAACGRLGIPVMLTISGIAGPDIGYADPVHVDRAALAFPGVTFIIAHGAWPWVTPILGVAFWRPNVYLLPDFYLPHMPARQEYVDAANTYLKERMIFGTGYPIGSLAGSLSAIEDLPFTPEARARFLGGNAAKLLGLGS